MAAIDCFEQALAGARQTGRYLIPYKRHRPHRTLGQRPPEHRAPVAPPVEGPVRRRRALGGLVNEYHRAA